MKKVRKVAFTIAFLDVLSNALVAILIVTLVRIQPKLPGEPKRGTYYISATSTNDVEQDSTIAIATKFVDFEEFAYEPTDYLNTQARLNYSKKMNVRVNFLDKPELKDFEEVIIYGVDPNFRGLENKDLIVELSFPDKEVVREELKLNKENGYKITIIKNGEIQIPFQ